MKIILHELQALIDYIQSVYSMITDEWMKTDSEKANQKKVLVSDISLDSIIYSNIIEYVQLLNEKNASLMLQLADACSCSVTARVKTYNSIEYKIQNYMSKSHESGKVPVQKCVNDLFGIRVILESPLTYEEINSFVNSVYGDKYKCINSSKGDYNATHIYFKESNRAFAWELQIWNYCDVDNNFASHKKYKQAYTTWEKESKEGGIING
ncbi:MAG: hypothetical protein IKT62_02585 [Firmicutes bacterium]|nr:hypothetical protein [Bacillota bacterium]